MRFMMALLAVGAVATFATGASAGTSGQEPRKIDDSRVCGIETLRQERLQSIPDRLLQAISLVESGRWDADRKESFAWPWTVMAEGEGRFLPTKAAAVAEVSRLKAKGVTNIDVGCMQVNLQAHPEAFANLDTAFDPATNVAYGARFLNELRASTSDWETAAAFYHSQTPALAAAYKAKLVTTWKDARTRADDRGAPAMELAALFPVSRPPVGMILPTPMQISEDPAARAAATVRSQTAAADAAAEADHAAKLAEAAAGKAEAKRIADAYREARLAEYRRHKLQMVDARG